jgi:hypothetical protein
MNFSGSFTKTFTSNPPNSASYDLFNSSDFVIASSFTVRSTNTNNWVNTYLPSHLGSALYNLSGSLVNYNTTHNINE